MTIINEYNKINHGINKDEYKISKLEWKLMFFVKKIFGVLLKLNEFFIELREKSFYLLFI